MKTETKNPPQYEWGPFPFGDGARILDIRYDAVVKAVFTRSTPNSRAALSDLISALIGRAVSVEVIIANEPPIDDLRQRHLRFNVACKSEKGEPINVEMSFNPKASAELWAVFFQYLTDGEKRDEIIEIINHEEGIAMTVDTLAHFTQDEIEYARMTSLLKGELDWQSGMAEARIEGLQEGHAEKVKFSLSRCLLI